MVTIITIGSSVALFACLLLLTRRRPSESDLTAAAFLLALALPMLEKLALEGELGVPYLPFAVLGGAPLTFGPFLYLYTLSVVKPSSVRRARSLWHFVPFAASVVVSLVPRGLLDGPPGPPSHVLPSLSWVVIPSLLVYSALIFVTLRRHRKGLADYFSSDSLATNLRWLNWVTGAFVLLYLLVAAGALAHSFELDNGTTAFIAVFAFAALKQPGVFPPPAPEATKYEKSGLREAEAATLLAHLKSHMEAERPWLDPDLSIETLATGLGVKRHYLTQVINEKLSQNFFRFVNEYRIAEVKRRIDAGDAQRFSLLGVALDCGFQSKSAFNQAFKTIQGCTPTEYRKSVLP